MNHKRRRHPNARAGSGMFAPWRANGAARTKHATIRERREREAAADAVFDWSAEQWQRVLWARWENPWRPPEFKPRPPAAPPDPGFGVMADAFRRRR